MAWLNNTAATLSLQIDGDIYSDELVSGQITDSTIANTGVILTSGTITLAELPGNRRLEDYRKQKFGRGKIVKIDVTLAGVTKRHPRGYLYITDSVYNMEARSLELSVGCELFMFSLTDNIEALRPYTIYTLPETATFADLSAAVQAEGLFLWQDNTGQIKKDRFFYSDGWGSNKEKEKWVSVRDYTALSVSPLSSGNPVPDKIEVTYTWLVSEEDAPAPGPDGKPYEEDLTESSYYLEHPANLKKTQKICTTSAAGVRTCRDVVVNAAKRTYAVTKTTASRRNYGGQGGSLTTEISITTGPAVEVNGSYYAERYAYELARANGGLDPTLKGLDNIVQEKKEKTYTYGSGGEVLKTVEDTFRSYLSAMTANDWRAGNAETGKIYDPDEPPSNATRGFLTSEPKSQMFLQQRVTTEWEYKDDRTIEKKTTLQSSAQCNGVGIYPVTGSRALQNIDATNNGVETTEKRTSMGGLLNPNQPPRNPGTPASVTKSATYTDESAKYFPTAAGSIVLRTNSPFNNPEDSENRSRERAAFYARTLRDLLEGDAAGIRVAETMRPEVLDEYKPGMAFSFYDSQLEEVVKLRMNATGWAFSPNQCIFSTDGLFIGVSNGTVNIPENVDAVVVNASFKDYTKEREEAEAAKAVLDETTAVVESIETDINDIQAEIAERLAPPPPDGIFGISIIQDPFIVTTGAPRADKVFYVATEPAPEPDTPDTIYDVTTGAPAADQEYEVTVAEP